MRHSAGNRLVGRVYGDVRHPTNEQLFHSLGSR
ncbi:hypothetical protein EYF80_016692 [Liparis tanakae]|uniref:Uncharacterized protein n=1 Tax=Liparis tanakae TaxID=230148 RepID=A0A4Z2I6V9_9TELE|nr:hypothetical protein EYF80_016692 [Liparis tanakae]